MLSREDNELLTQVGPGTPMGNLMRRFWLPFAHVGELPTPDCTPIRVRLLGEDLIAFRDSSGQVGLIGDHCPHRGASLFFGRNEENGLRCVYHGWKFDTTGACVDMPNEPPESKFKDKIHHLAYQTAEAGDVLWAYMGPANVASKLPEMEWMHVPASHRYVTKRFQRCSYLQNVEGEVDSSHVSFLHSKTLPPRAPDAVMDPQRAMMQYVGRDRAPHFYVKPTSYGTLIGARRDAEVDSYYWRITQFLMPIYTMIPPVNATMSFTSATPMDDENLIGFTVTWHPDRPLSDYEKAEIESWTGIHSEVDPVTFMPLRNRENGYLLDRELQRSGRSYTGIRGIREEDMAVQEGMGVVCDRTNEHLGAADLAVITMRRRLLEAVQALAERDETPYEALEGDAYRIRPASVVLPRTTPWDEGAAEALLARV
jgi:phenylpropionate dioxygenase-like ring-hydroxylating dioxygenase large terminal subunit